MSLTTRVIDAVARPMIYVRTRSSMQPQKISATVSMAFATLGRFMGEHDVIPLAPPLTVYSDWEDNQITVDVGFPVSGADAAKATGAVHAGKTPGGPAIKTIHQGAYDKLKETYALLDEAMKAEGYRPGGVSWEVYFGEPGKTPEQDLVTEIYMRLADPVAVHAAR